MILFEKYGSCIIPKGTNLFRRSDNTNIYETMFFGFSPFGTYNDFPLKSLQIWETISEIKSLYMIKEEKVNRPISAIVDIYNYYFPNDLKDESYYLFLKQGDTYERRSLIKTFKESNITSWTCSLENKMEMELFLFDSEKQNAALVKYITTVDKSRKDIFETNTFSYTMVKNCN